MLSSENIYMVIIMQTHKIDRNQSITLSEGQEDVVVVARRREGLKKKKKTSAKSSFSIVATLPIETSRTSNTSVLFNKGVERGCH